MSTCERMQLTHILEGLGRMLVPHRQHSLRIDACDKFGNRGRGAARTRHNGWRESALRQRRSPGAVKGRGDRPARRRRSTHT
jgi:hypothetical protein